MTEWRKAVAVCDSWTRLELGRLGFSVLDAGRWFWRDPAPRDRPDPPELHVKRVDDPSLLREFELVSIRGFESPQLHDFGPLELHGAAILEDPGMHVFVGRVDDEIVSVSMAYVTNVVGIYGVATPPEHRRRGYGEAMTWAAVEVAPNLPALLQPTALGESVYRRMGFAEIGPFMTWLRSH